ncbi:hypothetical protein ACDA63_04435 [Uliginosibacterium sp. sgz301328]|uniref:hypothetical protein n=1 Tax=Uliginosibacterium sp. sgz301328 TaxID=3243764 RepID=UPI00359EADF4
MTWRSAPAAPAAHLSTRLVAVLLLPLMAAACAQPAPVPTRSTQVMIALPPDVRADDAAWLRQLARAAGSTVHFGANMSSGWAAYRMDCVTQDPDCSQAIDRLRASGLVRAVERDARKSTR